MSNRQCQISSPIIYSSVPIEKGVSTMTVITKKSPEISEYAVNRISQKYDSYQGLIYRRRLSSTGEGSGDSSTTGTGSSCGEREERELDGSIKDEGINSKILDGHVKEDERNQVETFFKGFKTQVYVSGSLANLYTKSPTDDDWRLKLTGIPLVLLDLGEAKSRDKRKMQIILAERGTGFMLWQDIIDNLSQYKQETESFHTMSFSNEHSLQIGLSFDSSQAACEFWKHIEHLISDPENISLSVPGKKKKRKEKKQYKIAPLPPKNQISQPCCFQHVTTVGNNDKHRFYSLREYLPRKLDDA